MKIIIHKGKTDARYAKAIEANRNRSLVVIAINWVVNQSTGLETNVNYHLMNTVARLKINRIAVVKLSVGLCALIRLTTWILPKLE